MRIKLRDLVILPLLAVVTPALLLKSTDLALQQKYTTSASHLGQCLDYAHATAGIPGIPNCTTNDKLYETPSIQYRFNACGMNSIVGCKASDTGNYTIALLGSSVPFGQWVQFQNSIASQLGTDLSQITQQNIQVANYSRMEEIPPMAERLLPQVLKKNPALIVLAISPYDIGVSSADPDSAMRIAQMSRANRFDWWLDYLATILTRSTPSELADIFETHLKNRIEGTRFATLLLTYRYSDNRQYVHQYLQGQDSEIGYLPTHPSEAWKESYQAFNQSIAQMSVLTRTAGIPFVVVLLPTRAQEVMLNSGSWPPGYDPYLIDQKVKSIVTSHGGIYLDIFPECARITGLEKHYFIQNAHPDGFAHTVFARLIAQQLTSGIIPALRTQQPVGKEQ